jgi:hypothetical protein
MLWQRSSPKQQIQANICSCWIVLTCSLMMQKMLSLSNFVNSDLPAPLSSPHQQGILTKKYPQTEAESLNSESTKDIKAHLYDKHMEAECKTRKTLRYSTKIPSHELQTGLQITLVSRTDRDIGDVKLILCKQDCGIDPISCKKTHN